MPKALGGLFGGGSSKAKTTSEPWKEIQPFLLEGADYAQNLFKKGKLAPDNAGLGTVTRQGLSGIAGLARNNGVTEGATNALSGVLGAPGYSSTLPTSQPNAINVGSVRGPGSFDMAGRLPDGPDSYGSIDPNYGIDAVRQNVLETTLPQVAGMFGTGGFSNSSMAQSTAGRAVASALAPYEFDQVNRNQQLGIDQFNTEKDRELNFGLASAGMQADQFNTDEGRRLGFDLGERDTRLGQRNIDRDVQNSMALATDDRLRDQYNTQQAQQLSALGLAPSVNAMQFNDAQSLLGVGQIRDQNRQANMSEASQEAQAYANLMAQLGGLGQSSSQSPSTLDTLGGIGQLGTNAALAFSLFCDRRLKRDISPFCTWRGVAIYTFRYLWDDVLRVGPMAQEVPARARVKVGDFYAVNMGAI